MNSIYYHKATISDISILVENRILFALELSGEQSQEAIETIRKQLTHFFLRSITDQTSISFIAKCNGTVAGIGSMLVRETPGNFKNPTGKWGYIMNMYTLPAYRRKGICKSILDLLVEDGKKYSITAFELHATKTGEMVYVQNGFEIHREPTYRKYISKIISYDNEK
jgi:ribosomal protein S18 acetylase RimI-like enzyme